MVTLSCFEFAVMSHMSNLPSRPLHSVGTGTTQAFSRLCSSRAFLALRWHPLERRLPITRLRLQRTQGRARKSFAWLGLSCYPSNEPELDIAREAHASFGYLWIARSLRRLWQNWSSPSCCPTLSCVWLSPTSQRQASTTEYWYHCDITLLQIHHLSGQWLFLPACFFPWQASHFFGLAIGFCVVVGGFAIGNVSGGSLNPAVAWS